MKGRSLSIVLVFLIIIIFTLPAFAQQKFISIAACGTGGTFYPLGAGMAKIINKYASGIQASSEASGCAVENIRLVNGKKSDIAFSTSAAVFDGVNGFGDFKGVKHTNINLLFNTSSGYMQLVVLKASGIKSLNDLKGKKVSIGPAGSGTATVISTVLPEIGIQLKDFKSQFLSFSESADALSDRHIDAFFVLTNIPNSAIMQVGLLQEIDLIPFDESSITKIITKFPYIRKVTVPANTYKGIARAIPTIGTMELVMGRADLHEETVYQSVKSIFEHRSELEQIHVAAKHINFENALAWKYVPFHPGAVKYFKEKGIWKD